MLRQIDRFFPKYGGFWTTLYPYVYYPDNLVDPLKHFDIIKHETVHLEQQGSRAGKYWFLFLYLFCFFPIGLAYFRVKYEVEAYAVNVRSKHMTRDEVVHILWNYYGWPLPKSWIRKMLSKELRLK